MGWTCHCGGVNEEASSSCVRCDSARPQGETSPAGPAPARSEASPVEEGAVPPSEATSGKRRALALAAASVLLVLLGLCLMGLSSALVLLPTLRERASAKERLRQEVALSDLCHLAACCETFAEVNRHYPMIRDAEAGRMNIATAGELKKVLDSANACPSCPTLDLWGNEYRYGVTADGSEFALLCYGLGGGADLEAVPEEHVGTRCFEDDIVWLNDRFVQEPEGEQSKCY